MIKVKLLKDFDKTVGFEMSGHSETKVCASISALVQNVINFIYSAYKPEIILETEPNGYVKKFKIKNTVFMPRDIKLMLEFFEFSVKSYSITYPDHVEVTEVEI